MAILQSTDVGLLPVFMNEGTQFDLKRILVSAIILYVLYNALQTLVTAFTSPLRHIPGPFWSRFTNLPLKKAVVGGRRIFFIDDLHKQYGEVVRIAPDEVSISDMDGFKKIHAISATFNKSKWYEKLTIFPRHSVFTMMTKETHAARRKLFARGFSKSHLREHYEPILAEKAKLAVEGIKKRALNGNADLMQWWTFLATDTVGRLGFGESFGMLEKGEKTDYIRTLELALIGNGIGAELPFVRSIGRWIPAKGAKLAFDATDIILDYGQKAVNNAKRQASETNLMAGVLKEGAKEESQLDDLDIRVEATSLIFAGSGTTANTLTYLIWTVLKRPALHRRMEDELATLPAHFQDKHLEALPLLNAVLDETLRLYAAVPGTLPRRTPEAGLTVAGYYIPEGTTVGTQAYTMHRKEALWPDAHTFRPERWLPAAGMSSDAKTAFCAFGAGAYTCLGIHIAYAEMRYAAALFFRECTGVKLAESCTDECMEMENYFVITPKGHKCEVTLK